MGGLITAHHNVRHDGVTNLSGKASTPAHVRNYTKIFTGCVVPVGGKTKRQEKGKGKESPPPAQGEEKGELLIRDLQAQGTYSIHDMRVVNTDTVSYQFRKPEKCLETNESKKKRK